MAKELKEEQKLQELEARNLSQTGWERSEVSTGLFPASPCSLSTANVAGGRKKMGIAGSGARRKRASSCQEAAFTLCSFRFIRLTMALTTRSGDVASTWVRDGYFPPSLFNRSTQPTLKPSEATA